MRGTSTIAREKGVCPSCWKPWVGATAWCPICLGGNARRKAERKALRPLKRRRAADGMGSLAMAFRVEGATPDQWKPGVSRHGYFFCTMCHGIRHIAEAGKGRVCSSCETRREANYKAVKRGAVRMRVDGVNVYKTCKKCEAERPVGCFRVVGPLRAIGESSRYDNHCLVCVQMAKPLRMTAVQARFAAFVNQANGSGHVVGIGVDEWSKMMGSPCAYCGSTYRIGIDRMDSGKGYVVGNVCACCEQCNCRKLQLSAAEWMRIIEPLVAAFGQGRVWPKKIARDVRRRGEGRLGQRKTAQAMRRLFRSMRDFAVSMLNRA